MKLEVITDKPTSNQKDTPILFVHGMWHSARCWAEKFMPYFAQHGYETHALSLRGHGKSEGKNKIRWASIKDYVNDIAQVVEQMDKPPILVGHSMGGLLVQKYLETHDTPKIPGAVLLASATPKGVLSSTFSVARRYPVPFMKANLLFSLYPIVGSKKRCREFFFSENISDEDLTRYFSQLEEESFRAFMDMMFVKLPQPEQLKTKLLVLGAENDTAIKLKEIKKTAARYHTKATIFPGMAHNMMLDSNWQNVADTIMNWVE